MLTTKDWRSFKRLFPFIRAEWTLFALALSLMVVGVVLQLPLPLVTRYIIDTVLPGKNTTPLNWVIVGLVGFMVLKGLCDLAHNFVLSVLRERTLIAVQLKLFQHVQNLSVSFFKKWKSGYLVARLNNDVGNLGGLVGGALLSFLRDATMFVVGAGVIFAFHWKLALASLCVLPFFVASLRIFSGLIRRRSADYQEMFALVWDSFQDAFSGFSVVKSCQLERFEQEQVATAVRKRMRSSIRFGLASSWSSFATTFIGGVGPLVILWYGGREVMLGRLSLGTLMAFNLFLAYLYNPVQRLLSLNSDVHASLASLDRVFELFDTSPEVKDPEAPAPFHDVRGEVVLKNVCFAYEPGVPVLRDVNLEAREGETVALVGRSGAGKTSLVNLIPRFYDPQFGAVLVDGVDIRRVRQEDLRRAIGIVPQDSFLFAGTIRDNIRYGNLAASDDEIEAAAVLANADVFIRRLPHSYDTEVGERGVRLSGGERQRIAIARAVLRKPRLLILDEATSDLDSESERLIQDALSRLRRDRTTFVIAHRFSTVLTADKIVVLDEGKVLAEGTHDDLFKSCSFYRELCLNQFISDNAKDLERERRLLQ